MTRKYKRVCECGDVAQVSYKPKGHEQCFACSRARLGPEIVKARYKNHTYVRYHYFCPYCPAVRILNAKRKTSLCGACSRLYARKPKEERIYFDMETMTIIKPPAVRYFHICPDCDSCVRVAKKKAGIYQCFKCKRIAELVDKNILQPKSVPPPAISLPRKPRKPKKKEAYIPQARINLEIKRNREHRESVEAKKKEVIIQTKSDDEMMAEWLAKNEVTVLEPNKLSENFEITKDY